MSASEKDYLYRNEHSHVDTQTQRDQPEQVAMSRYQLGWAAVDMAVKEYLSETSRREHLKRVIFG
jgi:NADPH-dependent glutamate synthase beta subunit-like oxidoreductase